MILSRRLLALALFTAFAALGHAQVATWHGLHFGDTRDQVRAQLSAQHISVETSQEGALQSTADYDLFLPGLRYTLPFLSSYHFTDNGGLMDVTLTLDLPAMRRIWTNLGNDDSMIRFATVHLGGALAGRYGAPLYHSPSCEAESKEASSGCAVFWNGSEQSLLLERSATSTHGTRLILRYQMLAADL